MSDENPYKAPEAEIITTDDNADFTLKEPAKLPASSGWYWYVDGFEYFKDSPGQWILTMIVGFILMMVASMIPLIGQIFITLTSYIWIAGLMIGCKEQNTGKPFDVNYLFAGFKHNTGKLILLAIVAAIINYGILFAVMGGMFIDLMSGNQQAINEMDMAPISILLRVLIAMLIMIPVMMMMWFAPVLIVINDVSIPDALSLSFRGCLKNILPFLVYGIVGIPLFILSVIPLGAGLLILVPVIYASIFVSYKEIFIQATTK